MIKKQPHIFKPNTFSLQKNEVNLCLPRPIPCLEAPACEGGEGGEGGGCWGGWGGGGEGVRVEDVGEVGGEGVGGETMCSYTHIWGERAIC